MKKWLKQISGITAKENDMLIDEALIENKRIELLKQTDPKEHATKTGQPWISVLDVKVNEQNVKNGFFELDWNELFIQQLITAGYGTVADPQEEVVDRWFRDVVFNMLEQDGMATDRPSGYINVVPLSKSKSEVS